MSQQHGKKDVPVLRAFKRKKVMGIVELATLLDSSIATARRRLKQWRTFTSYNHNGRYYVLETTAKFDPNGLWRYKKIFFSKYGNLRKTIIHLVNNSPEGLSGAELGELVGLSPRSFLSHFRNERRLQREKIEGLYVYFSPDKAAFLEQKTRRKEEGIRKALIRFPTDAQAVVILVERIKYPNGSLEDFWLRLRKRGVRFSVEDLQGFFDDHDLLKKTPPIKR